MWLLLRVGHTNVLASGLPVLVLLLLPPVEAELELELLGLLLWLLLTLPVVSWLEAER